MTDEKTTPATGDEPNADANGTDGTAAAVAAADNPDAVKNAIDRQKAEAKAARDEAAAAKQERDALAQKVKEFEDKDKSDTERLTEQNETLKSELDKLKPENARLKVAVDKGLVGDKSFLVDRLKGDTVEELSKDADDLLAQFTTKPAGGAGFDSGARTNSSPDKTPEVAHNELILALTGHLPTQ